MRNNIIRKVFIAIITLFIIGLSGCNIDKIIDDNKDNPIDNPGEEPFDNPSNDPIDNPGQNDDNDDEDDEAKINDNNEVKDIEVDETVHVFHLVSEENGTYYFECGYNGCTDTVSFTATCSEGTPSISVSDNTITFGEVTEDTVYSLSGNFYGNIVVNAGDDYKFELDLEGFSLTSNTEVPILFNTADEVTISAKKNTENYIYDLREAITDEETIKGAIYSYVDLDIQGKGSLFVKSENNNGIHTKDNLNVKNLSMQIDVKDNALKGNDGVKIESGNITLIARSGDAIKTNNSHVSSKGKQKGDIKINGGNILIYAACDGLDAAHDVIIDESAGSVNLQIFTDKYSKYSEEVTAVNEENIIYIKYSSANYKYSIEYSNNDGSVWYNSSTYKTVNSGMRDAYYYFPITKPSGYNKIRVFIYKSTQEQGQSENYVACSDYQTINNNYDTIAITQRNGNMSFSWTNYTTQSNNGGPGGGYVPGGGFNPGGGQEGNTDKGDYSTKGIKADNEINISAGTIVISAYDDGIHTNNDVQLGEEGAYYYGTGDIYISGGNITLTSNDDGIHADGKLNISGGTISVLTSYEGLEGTQVIISGGNTSIISKDDGINATATSGSGIEISDGYLYVYAGGDGLDANSNTDYKGFVISGGRIVVISTGNADSALDTENGYTFTGGYVLAIGRSGGMGNESTKCSNFSTVGTSKTLTVSKDKYLVVNDIVTLKTPVSQSAIVIILGQKSATIASNNSTDYEVDANGVYWNK